MRRVLAGVLTMAVLTIPLMKTRRHPSVVVHAYRFPADTICRHHQILVDCYRQISWLCIASSSSIQPIQYPQQENKLFSSRVIDDDYDFDHHQYLHPLTNIGGILQNGLDDHVGTAFTQAGSAWLAKDWDGVTVALGEASLAISQHLRDTSASAVTTQLWTLIAQELKDISTIEGCSSVGPAASIPNWLSIQSTLRMLAVSDSRNRQDDWMEKAATEIDRLLESV